MSSEKARPEADSYVLTLQFIAGDSERTYLEQGLKEIPGTSYLIVPKPYPPEARRPHLAFLSGFNPADIATTTLTIASLLGNLVPLARLLLDLLKRKEKDEIIIKTHSGAVTIRSDMPLEIVVDTLRNKAKIVTRKNGKQIIAEERRKLQLDAIKKKKSYTKDAIKAYEALVKTFTAGPPLTEQWQRDKLKQYEKTLAKYRREFYSLKKQETKLKGSPEI
jgi:hypothetical protein